VDPAADLLFSDGGAEALDLRLEVEGFPDPMDRRGRCMEQISPNIRFF
jgi:hypothetical protein